MAAIVLVGSATFIFNQSRHAVLNPKEILLPLTALAVILASGLISFYIEAL